LAADPWLGEWLYGRAVQANGLKVMVLGPTPDILKERRDNSDLPVDPVLEQFLYSTYALRYRYLIIEQQPVGASVAKIMTHYADSMHIGTRAFPSAYVGEPHAQAIVIGSRSKAIISGDQQLPFSSQSGIAVGRLFGEYAFYLGWANAHECPPNYLRKAKVLITYGQKAYLWAKNYVVQEGSKQTIFALPANSNLNLSTR
jgi:hypothetical protein